MTPDTQRTVLAITGEDRVDFLQGLVTNDVARTKDGLVYAALLTPQGKYLADFFIAAEPDRLLVDVAASLAPDLLKRLTMYKLRAKVDVAATDLGVETGLETPPPGALADPRHPALGWRRITPDAGAVPEDDTALRVAHAIPASGAELRPNDTFILEAGFERLSGVDFRKGCYVGQEVTARMKHKTELRKGLTRVAISGGAPVGTPIMAGDRTVGTLFSQAGGEALAHLRFDQANGEMSAGDAQVTRLPGD